MIKHGYGFTTVYAHNKQNLVTVGQRVKRGEIIAISGNTGSTTGPHLHYEVWKNNSPVNPLSYLKEDPNVFKKTTKDGNSNRSRNFYKWRDHIK